MSERVLFYIGVALAYSAVYALAASRLGPAFDQWSRARHARRLQARLTRGSDSYFEELRALQSHAPRPYVAHGFAWHFVRTLAFMVAIFAALRLFDFLFSFSPE